MRRENIDKIAKTPEDRILLARVWDKIQSGIRKNIIANTAFLSPRELEMTRYLFDRPSGLTAWGGYPEAERKMLVYLPDYLDDSVLTGDDAPLVCLRATFYQEDTPSHRDFLGAMLGSGIARQAIGDICVGKGSCDFFVTAEIAPFVLQNLSSAGRTRLHLQQISQSEVSVPEPTVKPIRDTLASLRLDSIISAGFGVSRSTAVQYIASGHVAIDGLPCEKPDMAVDPGAKISVRGLGRLRLSSVNGQTKKGRISVVIDRYV